MQNLSPTAKVILGILTLRPRSGYEVKQFVDRSTRFFWTASYGQIYPELRRLEEAGLVEGADEATGDRARKTYRLTLNGKQAVRAWLREPPETYELRHEGMLKVFLADALPPSERAQRLLDMRDQHLAKLEQLREVEAGIPEGSRQGSTYLTLRFGIESSEWAAAWCERAARRVGSDATSRRRK
jgi:PadR family transcriptional regulator, regulatory protein AphA